MADEPQAFGEEREEDRDRVRTLTEKGKEEFDNKVSRFNKKLFRTWTTTQTELDNSILCETDVDKLKKCEQSLCFKYDEYRLVSRDFVAFLESTRTTESNDILQSHIENDRLRDSRVQSVLGSLDVRLNRIEEDKMSVQSKSSKRSNKSSTSSVSAKAKLEAAKARIAITRKEVELKKKQALLQEQKAVTLAKSDRQEKEIEAELCLLDDEKVLAEAVAENEVYETESESNYTGSVKSFSNRSIGNPIERTKAYVEKHSVSENASGLSQPVPACYNRIPAQPEHSSTEMTLGSEFARFLVKKDLLMTRFTSFQDDPITYCAWKNTFRSITKELGVTSQEETDLLVKWLGPESSKQAQSIRAANSHDPESCLSKIWNRLEDRYGAPELIENRLQKKVANFPRVTTKDYKKLYDLCDVLSETESVKEDNKYRTHFAHFDSPVGVNSLVCKLPVHLQSKWADRAKKYKVANEVTFPPFSFFVKFIKEMTDLFNDPSFSFETSTTKSDKDEFSRATRFMPVAKKTEVQSDDNLAAMKTEVKSDNLTLQETKVSSEVYKCPIHSSTSHALDSCRVFKKMPHEEKRKLLKIREYVFGVVNQVNT